MTQSRQQQDDGQRPADDAAEPTAEEAREPGPGAADDAAQEDEETAKPETVLEVELEQTKDRLLRTLAEMENLRRRTAREIDDARKYAVTGFARDLLEVADNLSRALESVPAEAKGQSELISNLAEGVALTEKALLGAFERHQIAMIRPEIGEKFDHNRHQAMFEVETDQPPPGTVAQVLQPGYVIADRLLRPAMVGVAKAPAGRDRDRDDANGGAEAEPDAAERRPGAQVDTTA